MSRVGYIRYYNRKYERFFKGKFINYFMNFFRLIKIEQIKNGAIIFIPERCKNVTKKISEIVKKNNIQYVIFDKNIKFETINYCNNSNNNVNNNYTKKSELIQNVSVLNGKYFMKHMVYDILKYILNKKNKNMYFENIYIFVNEYSKENIEIILNLVNKCKTINIITENLKYFKRLENKLYNEGILITVSNNKRKSARNAEFIINVDFSKILFEKYVINMNSIIINLTNETVFFERTFNGVIVNNIEIKLDKNIQCFVNEFYGNIYMNLYLESLIINKSIINVEKLFKLYKGKICGLIGIRGKIQEFN